MSGVTVLSGRGTSSLIDFLKASNGSYLYPITLTSAIYDLNGKSLDEILEGKQAAGSYAASSHNHDSVYSKLGHTHNYAGSSSDGGSANAAVKLANARKFTIGNTGKDFDGSGDVSWTLAEIGAAAASHGTHVSYGTANPAAAGTASAGSASTVSRSDHVHPAQTTVSGNAGSATKLQTARKFTIGGTGKNFDGTGALSWTLAEIGAAAASHSHNIIYSNNNAESQKYGNASIQLIQACDAYTGNIWRNSIKCLHSNSGGYYTEIGVNFTGVQGAFWRDLRGGVDSGYIKIQDYKNDTPCKVQSGSPATTHLWAW